ncbi:hypothetical protein TSUD_12320 [Trifolium subterraneum]|uniref:X8 domain-containing protein n=1 Tax=Trifolium subterraneum TaxID=3900 RepID=A0A2Z6LUM0_TRISU|nr:hypothetical protein TSUD_12320 [Trifolium subterraneum]
MMAKYSINNAISFLIFVIVIMLNAAEGGNLKFANADLFQPGTWCIAKPSDRPEQLVNLTLSQLWCGVGDCRVIEEGHGNCTYQSYPTEGGNFELAKEQEKTFCVPKPAASEQELIANIEYACAQLGD